MTVRSDNLCKLAGVSAPDNRQRNPVVVVFKKIRDVGVRHDAVDVDLRIPPTPWLQTVIECTGRRHLGAARSDGQHWQLAQLCFPKGLVENDIAVSASLPVTTTQSMSCRG